MNASIKGYLGIILLLLNFGVNPNKIDSATGTGPLHESVRYNDLKGDDALERLKLVHILAQYGASPDLMNAKREVGQMSFGILSHFLNYVIKSFMLQDSDTALHPKRRCDRRHIHLGYEKYVENVLTRVTAF